MSNQADWKVVVGAGTFARENPHFAGWQLTEEEDLNLLDPNDWEARFAPGSIAVLLAEHVWEHLTYEEGIEAAKVCYRYLKPGGYVRCSVPDGNFPDEAYQRLVRIGGPGPADHPAASHRIVHTYRTLASMFEAAGFQVKLLEYCDEAGKFHHQEWDETGGFIYRSLRFDQRNQDGRLGFVSLIVDAVKGLAQ